jgi:hypothetical protein
VEADVKLDQLFPKKYLQAADLAGKPRTLHIRSIEPRKMRNPTDRYDAKGKRVYEEVEKPVVFFHKKFAGIVLNKTRVAELADALKIEDTEEARDKWIIAFPDGNQIHFKATPAPQVDAATGEVLTNGQPPAE